MYKAGTNFGNTVEIRHSRAPKENVGHLHYSKVIGHAYLERHECFADFVIHFLVSFIGNCEDYCTYK